AEQQRAPLHEPPFAPRGAIPPLPQVRRGFDVRFVQGGALLLGPPMFIWLLQHQNERSFPAGTGCSS
ncbi:MAG: hypothetical protein QM607_00570, partial [Microbacterium sp.]